MPVLTDISVVGPGTRLVVQAAWSCVTGFGPDESEVREAFSRANISVAKIEETLLSGPTFRQVFVHGTVMREMAIGELRALLESRLNEQLSFACASVEVSTIETERIIGLDVPVTTTVSLASIAIIALVGLVVFAKLS